MVAARKILWKIIQRVALCLVVAYTLRAFVVEPFRVTDTSMEPTYNIGDLVYIWKLSYGIRVPGAGSYIITWRSPHRGDIVAVSGVSDPPMTLLREVAHIPTDLVPTTANPNPVPIPAEFFRVKALKSSPISPDSEHFGNIEITRVIGKVWK